MKKHRFWLRLRSSKRRKIERKWCRNTCFFEQRILSVFFGILAILARFLEASGTPKINKKSKKSFSRRFWVVGSILDAILERFGRILDGFGKNFRRIWNEFWKDSEKISEASWKVQVAELTLMIRATRGRSTDRQIDR